MRKFFYCVLVALPNLLWAQPKPDFQPLKSQGKLPQKFITASTQQYKEEVNKNISDRDKKKVKKAKDQFLLESSFGLSEILHSGKVIYNDPVGAYLNRVLDALLKDDKKLRSELSVYVLKSSEVNACTFNNGVILVNVGLLARLHNEAELAMALSHEITHYKKKHVINAVVDNQDVFDGKKMYRKASGEERLDALMKYSREQEWEADRQGFELFLKSNYDLASAASVFDILCYSNASVFNIPFDPSFLESTDYKFSKDLLPDSIRPILPDTAVGQYDNHPSSNLRKKEMEDKIRNHSNEGRKKFIVGETEFNNMQRLCRYDLCEEYIENHSYRTAIYHAACLLKDDPTSKYLQQSILRSLYSLSKIKSYSYYESASNAIDTDKNEYMNQGYRYQAVHLLDKIHANELNVVAVSYGWKLEHNFNTDPNIQGLVKDLCHDMLKEYGPQLADASPELSNIYKNKVGNSDEKIRTASKQKAEIERVNISFSASGDEDYQERDSSFFKNSLLSIGKDQSFTKMLSEEASEVKKENEKFIADTERSKKKSQRKKDEEHDGFNDLQVNAEHGIDRIIFVNPYFYKIDRYKKNPVRYFASEEAQQKLNNMIKDNARRAGIDCIMMDASNMAEEGTDTFNDITSLNEFVSEESFFDTYPYKAQLKDDIQTIREKYKTDYLCYTGFVTVKEMSGFKPIYFLYAFYPVTWPFIAYKSLKPSYTTYYFSSLYNIKTGECVHSNIQVYGFNNRQDVLNVSMYDLYNRYHKAH